MELFVLTLLGVAALAGAAGWVAPQRRALALTAVLATVLLAIAAVVAMVSSDAAPDSAGAETLMWALSALLAIAGGGPVTSLVFGLVDGHQTGSEEGPVHQAGQVLRGGAWIGALERGAVFASLVGGWPEGLAVVLALKGLGRYPELRTGRDSALAERFIIGTFTSALWAVACAGVAVLLG